MPLEQGANIVLLMNHELRDAQGIVRRHGEIGAFVSRWVIDPETLRVKEGSDLINPGVLYWDYPCGEYVTSGARWADGTLQERTFGRFCSNTLSAPGLFYNESTENGYKGQIFFPNEEDGDIGRAFAVTKDGDATSLPRLGLFQWENTIPAPNETDTTLVMGQEGRTGRQRAASCGSTSGPSRRAGRRSPRPGLTNGDNHVIDALDQSVSTDTGLARDLRCG